MEAKNTLFSRKQLATALRLQEILFNGSDFPCIKSLKSRWLNHPISARYNAIFKLFPAQLEILIGFNPDKTLANTFLPVNKDEAMYAHQPPHTWLLLICPPE